MSLKIVGSFSGTGPRCRVGAAALHPLVVLKRALGFVVVERFHADPTESHRCRSEPFEGGNSGVTYVTFH